MEEKRKEAFPEEPVSTANDAPPPYTEQFPSAVGYRRISPGGYDQQLPPPQGYPTTEPYPTQQYPPPQQQQYGYPQGVQPLGYSAPIAMQPTQVQPVRVNLPCALC